ncbi:(d)CMP kinase [Rhabdaerophilum sp.]|uniref:(d)CMP kinase n=1 Tax=Rhabdaerophilum sp. TaxID=2717341 RepID=UPI0038D3DB11
MSASLVIAVDGPAASGKGTIAKRLAGEFHLPMLDTGLLYRAVGQRMADLGLDLDDEQAAERVARDFALEWLVDERLRTRMAGEQASRVARFPGLRSALRQFQQDFARQPGGAVLDGRDIGTVIAPWAPVKLWIDAEVAVRANRRFRELTGRGETVVESEILADLVARDQRDAPNMQIAPNAIRLDTTDLNVEQAVAAALAMVRKRVHI